MAVKTSVNDGDWNDGTTWDAGIPTDADDAVISTFVTITTSIVANSVYITESGSLKAQAKLRSDVSSPYPVLDVLNINVRRWRMDGKYPDDRIVSLRGVKLPATSNDRNDNKGLVPSISCIRDDGTFAPTSVIEFDGQLHIMADPTPTAMSATMDTSKNEGTSENDVAWRYANPRSHTVTIQWSKDSPFAVGEMIDRMIAQPCDVLLVSHTDVMKGHIESKQPKESGGEGYHAATITVMEG